MLRFVLKRIAITPFMLFGVISLVFLLTNLRPATAIYVRAGRFATESTIQRLTEEYGLDKPLHIRYVRYLSDVVRGDFGKSILSGRPVLTDLADYLPASLELIGCAMVVIAIVGVFLGMISALHKDSFVDVIARGFGVGGIAVPQFWFGIMLVLLFFWKWGILPAHGRIAATLGPPQHITGLYIFDSLVAGDWERLGSALMRLILPVFALSLSELATVIRLMRNSTLKLLRSDYVLLARAHGLSRFRTIYVYVLKDAVTSIVTTLGLLAGGLLGGTFLIETVFTFPGVGYYMTNSIVNGDPNPVLGCVIVIAGVYAIANLLVDVCYALIDPRVRY